MTTICPTARTIRAAAIGLAVVAVLLATSCATMPKTGEWLPHAQQLTVDATKAHTRILTVAGGIYRAAAVQCTDYATFVTGDGVKHTDGTKLYECMRPANEGRNKVEAAATVYRKAAESVLESTSWADVLLKLPELKVAAAELALAFGEAGGDEANARNTLTAPIVAAEKVGEQ